MLAGRKGESVSSKTTNWAKMFFFCSKSCLRVRRTAGLRSAALSAATAAAPPLVRLLTALCRAGLRVVVVVVGGGGGGLVVVLRGRSGFLGGFW